MEWITTSTILRDLRGAADGPAWRRLLERFHRPIVTFAQKIGLSHSDAEDCAEETLIAFAAAMRDGRYDATKGRMSRWLFGFAYRTALAVRRREQGRPDRAAGAADEPDALVEVPDEATASMAWDAEWEQALLQQCLERVRAEVEEATFRAFEITVRDGVSPADAAETLGISIKSVYNARHRVLNRVRELRQDLEAESTE